MPIKVTFSPIGKGLVCLQNIGKKVARQLNHFRLVTLYLLYFRLDRSYVLANSNKIQSANKINEREGLKHDINNRFHQPYQN